MLIIDSLEDGTTVVAVTRSFSKNDEQRLREMIFSIGKVRPEAWSEKGRRRRLKEDVWGVIIDVLPPLR